MTTINVYETALKGNSHTEISDIAEKVAVARSSMFKILKEYETPSWLQSINKTQRVKYNTMISLSKLQLKKSTWFVLQH